MEVLTKITIRHKQYPLFKPRREPRTSGIRNIGNYSTAFIYNAPSILTTYPKTTLQCVFELINGLSSTKIPIDLKYFSLRTLFCLLSGKEKWNYIRTGLALSEQWLAVGWKPVVRFPILKAIFVCQLYWLCGSWSFLSSGYRIFFPSV